MIPLKLGFCTLDQKYSDYYIQTGMFNCKERNLGRETVEWRKSDKDNKDNKYLGSNISSTESDANLHIDKAWTIMNMLIWKFDLTDRIRQESF